MHRSFHTDTHSHTHTHTHTHTRTHTHVHLHMHAHLMCICTCTWCIYMYIVLHCIYMYMYMYTCTLYYIHVHVHVHAHVYMYVHVSCMLQEWLRVLKRYTLKTREAPKSEVQQIRSLSLSIRDCKLAKPGAHPTVYCLVSLDGAALAKSIIVQMPCTFDENYKFQ